MPFEHLLRPELADLTSYVPSHPDGIRVRLDANEAPAAPEGSAVADVVRRAVSAVPLERYPDARATALKAALARLRGVGEDELLVGSGSDEIIALLLTALARPRGKNAQAVVLVPAPTFVMYKIGARAHGLKPVEVALDAGWDLDVGSMTRAIELLQPNIVFVASPNNPTSNAMSEDRLDAVVRAAQAGGALAVVDEAYGDYAEPLATPRVRRTPGVAVIRTLSKIGLAALRVGWLEADAALVAEVDKVRQPFNVSATSQAAARAVLEEAWGDVQALVARVVAERARLTEAVAGVPRVAVAVPSSANFLWLRTERPAVEVYRALVAEGVLVRSFHGAGGRMTSMLRVTVGTPAENDALLEALRRCV